MSYFKKQKKQLKVNVDVVLSTTFVRQPSLVDSYYYDSTISSVDGLKEVGIHNPLYMLFNQERLDRLGVDSINKWIESMNQSQNSSLNELKKKCSDDDLLNMIRSRHIQHPAELERYINDLNARADKFNSEIARVRAELDAEQNAMIQQQLNTE